MIITRSPLRISLGGGGTDLPSYYHQHGGFLIAAAIDKYVMITLHDTFQQELIIRYSRMERVSNVEQIEHPIIREALRLLGDRNPTRLELINAWRIFPPAPAWVLPAVLPRRCCRHCMRGGTPSCSTKGRAGRTGLPYRARPAEGTDRQAGSVHRRFRRRHLLHLQSGRHRRGAPARGHARDAL